MIDTIHIATSGLAGHQQGLRVIGNNVSNMNTIGFKASRVDFADVYSSGHNGGDGGPANDPLGGAGLDSQTATLDLSPGEFKSTGRDLDMAISGPGFFIVRTPDGKQLYTRSGDFEFNAQGVLVMRGSANQVMAFAGGGSLQSISIDSFKMNPQSKTTKIVFSGNLSSTGTTHTIDAIKVYDPLGAERTLKFTFSRPDTTSVWKLTVSEGSTDLITAVSIPSLNGSRDPAFQPIQLNLPAQSGSGTSQISIDLAADFTFISTGTTSIMNVKEKDGYPVGQISAVGFDEKGTLKITYSNQQKVDGATLAVAEIRSSENLSIVGDAMFDYVGEKAPEIRTAGHEITLRLRTLELSNAADLSNQFSSLLLMQRGYQASSQVLTTANEMLQQLFEMARK